jgi:acylphosphatase
VGFRWFAREAARRLGLAGWVRNRADGRVEIAVEGDPPLLEQFLRQVERGPSGAVVERVHHLPTAELEPLPRPFAILH